MYQSERLDKIMEILNKYSYITVKYLTYELGYSTATINRDLNLLQQKQLIKRSYGGVELCDNKTAPLLFRYGKMGKVKNNIAKKATELVSDGDVIFLDGSTTTEAMGKFLINKKDITVITNNIALVLFLKEHNVDVLSLGGRIVEAPYILGGTDTEDATMKYKANKLFFASSGMTPSGEIQADPEYETLRRIMRNNSDESYYLIDSEKILKKVNKILFTPNQISGIISDYSHLDEIKRLYPSVKIIKVENS